MIYCAPITNGRHIMPDDRSIKNTSGHFPTLNLLRKVLLSWKSSFQPDWHSWIIIREGRAFLSFSLSFPPWSSLNMASVSNFSFSIRSLQRDEGKICWDMKHNCPEYNHKNMQKKKIKTLQNWLVILQCMITIKITLLYQININLFNS